MAYILSDRVLEASTSAGTGPFALLGAVLGFRAFTAVCAVSDTVPYFIEAVDADGRPTGDYEFGLGTYSAANQLTRTTIRGSSNGGLAVSFPAGNKLVGLGVPAPNSAATRLEWRTALGLQPGGDFSLGVAMGGTGQTTAPGIQSILPVQQVRVDVASATTVVVPTTTDHINITGTTTINGFTIAAGRSIFVRFSGSLILTSGAAITTQSGANLELHNGDTCILRSLSANTVEVVSRSSGRFGTPPGSAPIYGARAWVNFDGATGAVRASGNISSVTRNGVGDYTVNFSTAMPDTNYAVIPGGRISAPGYSSVQTDAQSALTAGAFRVSTVAQSSGTPTPVDCPVVSLAVFR